MEPWKTLWGSLKTSLWSTRSAWCCSRWAARRAQAVVVLMQDSEPLLSDFSSCLLSNHTHSWAAPFPPTVSSLYLLFQWIANPLNDMYADAVTTVVLEVQSNPKAQKGPFGMHCLFVSLVFKWFMTCLKHATLPCSLFLFHVIQYAFYQQSWRPRVPWWTWMSSKPD